MRLLGAGTILNEVIAAAELLEKDWRVAAEVYSVTSFTELRREGDGRFSAASRLGHSRLAAAVDRTQLPQPALPSSPRPTTSPPSPTSSAPGSPITTSRSAPTASGAATRAPTCAASSRSIATRRGGRARRDRRRARAGSDAALRHRRGRGAALDALANAVHDRLHVVRHRRHRAERQSSRQGASVNPMFA